MLRHTANKTESKDSEETEKCGHLTINTNTIAGGEREEGGRGDGGM